VLDQAQVGDNVGLLFAKLDKGDVNAGDVVSGAGVAVGAMPPAPPPPPTSTRDPRFAQVEQQRTQLLSMREAGVMTTEQIDAALRDLMFAVDGRHWILNAGSDAWYSSDGRPWKQDTPPS